MRARSRARIAFAFFAITFVWVTAGTAQNIDAPVRTPQEQERIAPKLGPAPDPPVVFRTTPFEIIPGAEQQRFVLRGVIAEGDLTVFSEDEIRARFASLIETEVSLADVLRVAQCIEGVFGPTGSAGSSQCERPGLRDLGYITSRVIVPAQRIEDGVFRIRIVEGFIADVRVEAVAGSASLSGISEALKGFGEVVTSTRPITRQALERALLLANDQPGIDARATIEAAKGPSAVGASHLTISAKRDPFDFFIVADNRGSELTGPWAAFAGFATNSFTRYAERIEGIVYSTVDFEEQIIGQLTYSQLLGNGFLGRHGARGGVSISNTTTRPGADLTALDIDSDTFYLDLFLTYPFVRSQSWSLAGRIEGAWTDTHTDSSGFRLSEDNIRRLTFGIDWSLVDSIGLEGDVRLNATTAEFEVRQGIAGLGATSEADLFKSRPEAGGAFTIIAGDISRRQRLPFGATTNSIPAHLLVRLAGQWASEPLFAVEEFQLGGSRFGRGYEPSELAGDHAFTATAELQADLLGQLKGIAKPRWISDLSDSIRGRGTGTGAPGEFFNAVQAYAFYDYGTVWNRDSTVTRTRESLSSAGIGFRLRFLNHVGLDLEAAKPLTRDTRADGDRDWAAFLRISIF